MLRIALLAAVLAAYAVPQAVGAAFRPHFGVQEPIGKGATPRGAVQVRARTSSQAPRLLRQLQRAA
jgi:hypothetical protein